MKKFRRIISGFLAAALILTQSMTTAYSDDLPDAAGTTTSAAETTTVDTEGSEDSTTGETSASDDETSPPEESDPGEGFPEDTDTDTTESADGDEKGEDVEYIEITALPTKTVYFIGDDFDLSGGKFTVYHANGESEELDMAEELSRGTLVVTGYDAATLGEQTITLTYLEKTVSFTVSVVADPENDTETESATYADGSSEGVLTLNNGIETRNYPNFEQAFAAVEPDRVNTITVNEDISVPYGEFTLPTAAQIGTGSIMIKGKTGSETLTLNGVTSLSPGYDFYLYDLKLVPLDSNGNNLTSFTISGSKNVDMRSVTIDPATTVNVSVGAGSELYIRATSAKFGTLTGTTTSTLDVNDSSITADKVTTFSSVYAQSPITVTTSMTGVGTLMGDVILHATATATITECYSANITLLAETDTNGNITKLAKPTITSVNVANDSTFTVKKPVVNEGVTTYEEIPVPFGTPIFTFNGTEAQFNACKSYISIANKTATEKELTLYYYDKEIRAEYDGVLTLNGIDYPNFEKAFAAVE
ncbi:MAG: bacterial Ig-like domain-containing protein, partial [Ruminiclostridium sp.]|nr:bacterial Ig-like domain-containing protein [Ruminiclostridium sp.]